MTSYLRSFAADGERKKIWTFGKNGGDFELRAIKKVAVKFYLYAPKGPQGRDYAFEDKLASLEEMFGEEFWKTVCTGFVNLGDEAARKAIGSRGRDWVTSHFDASAVADLTLKLYADVVRSRKT